MKLPSNSPMEDQHKMPHDLSETGRLSDRSTESKNRKFKDIKGINSMGRFNCHKKRKMQVRGKQKFKSPEADSGGYTVFRALQPVKQPCANIQGSIDVNESISESILLPNDSTSLELKSSESEKTVFRATSLELKSSKSEKTVFRALRPNEKVFLDIDSSSVDNLTGSRFLNVSHSVVTPDHTEDTMADNASSQYSDQDGKTDMISYSITESTLHRGEPFTVHQSGDTFIPSQTSHKHSAKLDEEFEPAVTGELKDEACKDCVSSAQEGIESRPLCHDPSSEDVLPDDKLMHNETKGLESSEVNKVRYSIIEGASQRGKSLLVDSIGYRYNFNKKFKSGNVMWSCPVRNKKKKCPALVQQVGNQFTVNLRGHNHSAKPGTELKAKVAAELNTKACEDIATPAQQIVEDALCCLDESKSKVLPNRKLLVRQIKRKRKIIRGSENKDCRLEENKESNELVQYSVIEGASQRGKSILVDNIGYKYNMNKKYKSGKVIWACMVQNENGKCKVRIQQAGDLFKSNQRDHNHLAQPGTVAKARFAAEIKAKLVEDNVSSTRKIVENLLLSQDSSTADVLPDIESIKRLVNRKRQKERQLESKNCKTKVNTMENYTSTRSKKKRRKIPEVSYPAMEGESQQHKAIHAVSYFITEDTSQHGKKLLLDTDGYTYTCRVRKIWGNGKVSWKCANRDKNVACPAAVQQNGDSFIPSHINHSHPAEHNTKLNI